MDLFPTEILLCIISSVELTVNGPSSLGNLFKCSKCFIRQKRCRHLHPGELVMAYNLRNVCILWDQIIRKYYGSYRFWIQT